MKTLKSVNIVIGRFQPITKGHTKCMEVAYQKTGNPTVLCMIETTEPDERHPFLSQDLIPIYKVLFKSQPFFEDLILVKNADIVAISQICRYHGYEISSWSCGTDRVDSYSKMAEKYAERAELSSDFQIIEIPRNSEDISATKLRAALMAGNKKEFLVGFPKLSLSASLRVDFYEILRNKIRQVLKESVLDPDFQIQVVEGMIRDWLNKYLLHPEQYIIDYVRGKFYVRVKECHEDLDFYNGAPGFTNGIFEWALNSPSIDLSNVTMKDLTGCPSNATSIGIWKCPSLTSLYGVPKKLDFLSIHHNNSLVNLHGLEKTTINEVVIDAAHKLVTLEGLGKVKERLSLTRCGNIRKLNLKSLPKELRINDYSCPKLELTPKEQQAACYIQ